MFHTEIRNGPAGSMTVKHTWSFKQEVPFSCRMRSDHFPCTFQSDSSAVFNHIYVSTAQTYLNVHLSMIDSQFYPQCISCFTTNARISAFYHSTHFKLFCIFYVQWKHLMFCLLSHRDGSCSAGSSPEGRLEAERRFGNHHHLHLLLLLKVQKSHICTA